MKLRKNEGKEDTSEDEIRRADGVQKPDQSRPIHFGGLAFCFSHP